MTGHIVKITVEDTRPPVWRRVVIPAHLSFGSLHDIIQILFSWEGEHLHDFTFPDTRDRVIMDMEEESWYGTSYRENKTDVDDFLKTYKWIRYTYDFGDSWRHKIVFEKDDPDFEGDKPVLLKYKGDNFMEDSGGVYGGGFMDDDDEYVSNRFPFDEEEVKEDLSEMSCRFIK